jgi:8-oxo-dGTP diphosphatase
MKPTKEVFGNKLRIRACGLCYKEDSLLLIKHDIDGEILWAPPGGGVQFGETIEASIIREFKEECNLDIVIGEFQFFTEYISLPLHAIELFYKIELYEGDLAIGNDPEIEERKIIVEVDFFNQKQINSIPDKERHAILKNCTNPIELLDYRGHFKY